MMLDLSVLDFYDYIALERKSQFNAKIAIYQRKLKSYELIAEASCFEELDFDNVKLWSKDQKIPLLRHYLSDKIKEKFLSLEASDTEEIEELLEQQKNSLFGQSRLKQAKLSYQILSQVDEQVNLSVSLVPDELLKEEKLADCFILLPELYNSVLLEFEKKQDASIIFFDGELVQFSFLEKGNTLYQNAFVMKEAESKDDTLSLINKVCHLAQKDIPQEDMNELLVYNSPFPLTQQNIKEEKIAELDYLRMRLNSLRKIENKANHYISKQRLLKTILAAGLLFISFFIFAETLSFIFSELGDSYSNSYLQLSKPLLEMNQAQDRIRSKEELYSEISRLQKNRSTLSSKLHELAKYFDGKTWLKTIRATKDGYELSAFALNRAEYNHCLGEIEKSGKYEIHPVKEILMHRRELLKKEFLNYASLLYFELRIQHAN